MQYHTKTAKNITVPVVDIPSDIGPKDFFEIASKRFDGPEGCVPVFALIPVELFPQSDGDVTKRVPEQKKLVKNRKQPNEEAGPGRRPGRQLMAILVADIVGYCRLMHADEAGTVRCLNAYKEMMAGEIAACRGLVVDSCGDNLMAAFMSAVNAVRCAVTLQKRLEKANQGLPDAEQMNFRMGLHLGDVINQGPCLYGNTINIAARLQSLADPGGIRISRAVHEQVEHKMDLPFYNLGERYVKNIPHPIIVYRVGHR